jgi:gamma-glutamyl hercynylcysteine S-oxide synthase
MQWNVKLAVRTAIAVLGIVAVGLGLWLSDGNLSAAGAVALGYLVARRAREAGSSRCRAPARQPVKPLSRPAARPKARAPVDPGDTRGLVEQMLSQGRFALLLRPQVVENLDAAQFRKCLESLAAGTALVPEGEVVLGRIDEALDDGKLEPEEIRMCRGRVVRTEPFFLDRYPVTNQEFYEFVAAGGYQEISLWDPKIWPGVLELVDCTGAPGPRYWCEGCYAEGEEDLPVTGVNWFEAAAYARWLGKRLPSDAEWVKAGAWPVPLSEGDRQQRKYPWGNSMDRRRANLWGSGPGRIVPVTEFAEGVSVGGVYQLIGNVWEWTGSNFNPRGFSTGDYAEGELVLTSPMKSLRGGAFDTYFDNQASCQFQSGENPLARRHNVSFRCAVGAADLVLARSRPAATSDEPGCQPCAVPVTDEGPSRLPEEARA